jgi:hypothetical protein
MASARTTWSSWLLVAVVAVVACRPPPPGDADGTPGAPFVSLQREVCFGECPIYRIAAYRDGEVRYEGEDFVEVRGRYIGRITEAQIRELDELFVEYRFFAMKDAYVHADWTDMPTVKVGYVAPDGRWKFVEHYHGDESAPQDLTVIEANVDRILDARRWVGRIAF